MHELQHTRACTSCSTRVHARAPAHARGCGGCPQLFLPSLRSHGPPPDPAPVACGQWDVASAGCIRLLHGHDGPVCAAAIAPDGATAASASVDGTVKLWHLASGRQLCTLPLPEASACAVSYSSSGRLLACAGERQLHLWQVRDVALGGEGGRTPCLSYETPVRLMGASFLPSYPILVANGVECS